MAGASTKWTTWIRRALVLTSAVLAGSVAVTACSGTDDNQLPPPVASSGSGGADGGTGGSGPCADGDEQECHVTIGEHEGVLTCLDGTQECVNGTWAPCNGVTTTRSMPAGARHEPLWGDNPMPLNLSDASPCTGNPCDPSCQTFNEDPGPGGVTIPSMAPPFPWDVGDINDLPPGLLDQGTTEPCTTAEDCQFDQFCENPARGACSHHPCATGPGLFSTCSPCVQKICNTTPSCCLSVYSGACLHDPCSTGSALKNDCEPDPDGAGPGQACVQKICAARPQCCAPMCTSNAYCQTAVGAASTCDLVSGRCTCGAVGACPAGATCTSGKCVPFWGTACKNLVTAAAPAGCGKTCPPANQWTAACVSKVNSVCGTTCTTDPPCAHDKCYSGDKLASACDGCVASICAIDASCCLTQWTQGCVDKVKTVCGEACPVKGQCEPWQPDDFDPSCATADLTASVPCGGLVPVCNRGSLAVPAGATINVVRYPAGAGEMPSSAPNQVLTSCSPNPGAAACSMTLTAPLAPGQCVNVTGCMGLANGMELMVNPTGPNHINECHCENNWSIYQDGLCTSPGCIAKASVSLIRKVNMFVAVDRSTSMSCSNNGCPPCTDRLNTRWNPVKNALKAFFQDPSSAEIGVALRFWPDGACNDPGCPTGPAGACAVPEVPLGTLTAASGAADPQETALVNAVNVKTACGDTPMYPALDGATQWAIARKVANPNEEVVVVFVTDGIPTHCNTDNNAIAGLAGNAFQNYGVRTYVIGVSTQSNPTQIDQIASAGGGSSFFLDDTVYSTGAAMQQALLDAMLSIRGESTPCDVSIPLEGVSDPANVIVTWTNSMGMTTTLTYNADPATCGTGWYVDPVNPELARLCPATCAAVQANQGGKVEAEYGNCSTNLSPLTYTQTYQAQCPPGAKVQWGYLTYDSTTPGDSNVQFAVRAAEDDADLPSATVVNVATARSTPTNTQVCDMGGPAGCPIDLFTKLGGLPSARYDYLELIMILNPTSSLQQAPTVHSWEISYSCPFSE